MTCTRVASADFRTAAALREALRVFERRSEQAARKHGLTHRSYQLLLMIRAEPSHDGYIRLRDLVRRLQLGRSTVTELVLRAERRRLVRREPDRDSRREIGVRLTPEGLNLVERVFAELGDEREQLRELIANLSG